MNCKARRRTFYRRVKDGKMGSLCAAPYRYLEILRGDMGVADKLVAEGRGSK
jgi:hypothetical protein